jgi:hypothetical protein
LKAIKSSFLTKFAFSSNLNQLCIEESFILIFKCLINAKHDSYFSEINLNEVIENILLLTNPTYLNKYNLTNCCHENIFRYICSELIKDEITSKVKILKLLKLVNLSYADYFSRNSIYELIEKDNYLLRKNKILAKITKKLSANVLALLA